MNIFEKLEKLNDNFNPIYCTNSGYDILNLLRNKPMNYSIIYDHNIKYYIIGDRLKYVHLDLLDEAVKQGLYYSLNIMSYNKIEEYYFKEYKGNKLICFTFNPEDNASIDKDRSSDGYKYKYKFDFGNIFTRQTIDNIPLDFGKYEMEELVLNESIENLDYSTKITKSNYDIRNIMLKTSHPLRISYDPISKYYICGDLGLTTHYDNLVKAWKTGLFSEIKKEDDLYFTYNKNLIDFCFQPIEKWKQNPDIYQSEIYMFDKDRSFDGYDMKWVYDFGFIYPNPSRLDRKNKFEDCPLYSLIGEPKKKIKFTIQRYKTGLEEALKNNQKLNDFTKINERLEKIIESFN